MNEIEKYKTLNSEILVENFWWQYIKEQYILPTGNEGEYHYIKTPGSCFIIPITKDGKFIMVRQFRYLNKKYSIEFPGGGVKSNITVFENAKNELIEEAGYKSNDLSMIAKYNPFNGVTDEICNIFVAKELVKVDSQPEESEEFEIIELSKEEVIEKISTNEIWDGMTLAAWSLYYFKNN